LIGCAGAIVHLEALRAFRYAQTLDSDCAMCFWGEAYVLGPNLNLPMEAGVPRSGSRATEKEDLGLKPPSRLEQVGDKRCKQAEDREHQTRYDTP